MRAATTADDDVVLVSGDSGPNGEAMSENIPESAGASPSHGAPDIPDTPDSAARFATTNWQLVVQAGGGGDGLAALLRMYWSPIYAFLRRRGHSRDVAGDLTQDFIAEVVLRRDLISRARQERGRFRTFIQTALRNFVIDTSRTRQAKAQRETQHLPPEELDRFVDDPAGARDPAEAFDRAWATSVIENTLRQLEADCRAAGLERHWQAYALWVVGPSLGRTRPASLAEVAAVVGAASGHEVSILLHAVKRRFVRTFRQIVGQTLDDPHDIDAEIMTIKRILQGD